MGAMLGVVFSDNLMVLYVFWELTSVSSFLLIAFWNHRKGFKTWRSKSNAHHGKWWDCDACWFYYASYDDWFI